MMGKKFKIRKDDLVEIIAGKDKGKRGNVIRVLRDNTVIFEGELDSLRRFKDDVSEVKQNNECGICVKNYQDVRVGDRIECFEKVEVARTLD